MPQKPTYEELEKRIASLESERAEQKKVEALLQEREEHLQSLGNAMPDLAFVLDEEGRYLEVLSGEGHLLYRTANELKGHLMHDTLPKELADHALDKIRKTIDITRKSQGTIELALFDIDPPGDKRECYDRFIH